jgi:tRNA modification GTPase
MLARQQDPIAAIATAPGRGAVGIVRVSGARLAPFIQALWGGPLQARLATYGAFRDADGRPIDQGLAIFFPAPASYTGEDVLELQAHGGPVVLDLLLQRCLQLARETDPLTGVALLSGLRLAEPGEFTRRAFLNGKMDLAQAEAVADLIDAGTEAGARSAARSLAGEFSREIDGLMQQLVHLRMLVEATLDFPEEDIDFIEQSDARGQLDALQERLALVLRHAGQGAILREGIRVVIAGQPNAGKSSLLNALAGAERAIVTPIAGTTRDKVTELIEIDGVPLHVVDTAGLRQSSDLVEQLGIERAWQEIGAADVVLFLHDWPRHRADDEGGRVYRELDAQIAQQLPAGIPVLQVWNKMDGVPAADVRMAQDQGVFISAKTGEGLDALRRALLEQVGWQNVEGLYMARARHLQALRQVSDQLDRAKQQLTSTVPALDLLAEDLRQAQNALGQITGEFTSDDLLGVIFSSFCIGK